MQEVYKIGKNPWLPSYQLQQSFVFSDAYNKNYMIDEPIECRNAAIIVARDDGPGAWVDYSALEKYKTGHCIVSSL
jgi:hypothetical protein